MNLNQIKHGSVLKEIIKYIFAIQTIRFRYNNKIIIIGIFSGDYYDDFSIDLAFPDQ